MLKSDTWTTAVHEAVYSGNMMAIQQLHEYGFVRPDASLNRDRPKPNHVVCVSPP